MKEHAKLRTSPTSANKASTAGNGGARLVLDEVEQTLEAARAGEVDTLIIRGPHGERVFTLVGADHAYRVLLEAMSEGVAKLTEDGIVDYCNARFAAIVGLSVERMLATSLHDYVRAEERARFTELLSAGARERSAGEFRLQSACNDVGVPVLLSVVPLTMHGAARVCVVMTDLTAQNRSNEAIASERAALQARLLLADRMVSMGTLAAGVAHEINNPLAYAVATIDLMIDQLPAVERVPSMLPGEYVERLRTQLARAREGADRVRVIVRDLKSFSSADDETVSSIDPKRALDSSISMVQNEIKHRARLVRDYASLPNVRANEARMAQVFVNLLVNAVDAIPAGAADRNEIRISGYVDNAGLAVVEVRDSGAGIAPENLARIFEPFFTTKPVGAGTGLGLALCRGIVDAFGGRITVESAIGAGSVFRVALPAVSDVARDTAPMPRVRVANATTTSDSRGRLLVIDDEEDLCETVRDALTASHDVVTTTDAQEALTWIAAGQRFDLIVCDVRMPVMGGLEFYKTVSLSHPEQAGRVTLMSGGFRRRPGEGSEPPGPMLEKPFEMGQLDRLVREAVQRGPRPQ